MCLYGNTINVYMMMYIYMATLWVLLLCGVSHGSFTSVRHARKVTTIRQGG